MEKEIVGRSFMLEEQTTLITFLKEVIREYENKIELLKKNNDSILILNRGLLDEFRDDINVITDIDVCLIEAVLEEASVNKSVKEDILKYFDVVKKLLTLNKKNKTSYEISEEQLKYIRLFFDIVDELEKKNTKTHLNNLQKIAQINSNYTKFRDLLKQLENKNNKEFISDIDTIEILLNENKLSEKTKRGILINIMKYNQKLNNS